MKKQTKHEYQTYRHCKTDNKSAPNFYSWRLYQTFVVLYQIWFMEIYSEDIKKRNVKKHLSESQQRKEKGELILFEISTIGSLICWMKMETSQAFRFSEELQRRKWTRVQALVFVAVTYGFSDYTVYSKQGKISLSLMTFSHQMVRLFYIEQLLHRIYDFKGMNLIVNNKV